MTKTLMATILAAAMAFTTLGAAPAKAADSGEIGRLLLGTGVLIILGNELANNNNRNRHVTRRYVEPPRRHVYREVRPRHRHVQRRHNHQPRYHDRDHGRNRW